MRYFKILSMGVLLALSFIPSSFAYDTNGCSIWLCLPSGFPNGCGAAHSEFINRIKHGHSPMPSWGSCADNSSVTLSDGSTVSGSTMTSVYKNAAYVPSYKTCTRWHSSSKNGSWCETYTTYPPTIYKGRTCHITHYDHGSTTRSPSHCTLTLKYIQVYADGDTFGTTYWWYGVGTKFTPPSNTVYK